MRLVNLDARLGLDIEGRFIDVEARSDGRFPSDPMSAFAEWEGLRSWAAAQRPTEGDPEIDVDRLGPPIPRPSQVFAIGLNYKDHAEEANLPLPTSPMTGVLRTRVNPGVSIGTMIWLARR